MSAQEVKLGGTYRHYKTKGLYTALQLVKFEPTSNFAFTEAGEHNIFSFAHFLRGLKFTGDGPNEDTIVKLYCSVRDSRLFLEYDLRFADARENMQVLYWSFSAKDYFVRPLTEFAAQVNGEPRFALVPVATKR